MVTTTGRWVLFGLGSLSLLAAWGCGSSVFSCSDDEQCGATGICQMDVGYCSFPDDECASEQRYGEHAGDGLAGTCVGEGGGSTSSSSAAAETSGDGPISTDDGVDSTGIAGECEAGEQCVAEAPQGWEGPVLALQAIGSAPSCPEGVDEVLVANTGLSAPPASCECTCGPADCQVDVHASLSGGCEQEFLLPFDVGVCQVFDLAMIPLVTTVTAPPVSGCTPLIDEQIPEASWSDEIRLCSGELAGCSDGLCAPDPIAGEGVCVYREGEHTCPLSEYTQAFTMYRRFDDSRECSECGCSGSSTCEFAAFANASCDGMPAYTTTLEMGFCVGIEEFFGMGMQAEMGFVINSEGACEPERSVPTGDVTPAEAVTLCCRP